MCPSGPLSSVVSGSGLFSPAWNVLGVRFRSGKSAETLVGGVADQRFQTQSNGLGVGACSAGPLGLLEELCIDIQGLFHDLHMYDYAI